MSPSRRSDTSLERTNGIGPCDLCQVYPSPETDTEPDIDIIAIHGLDTKSPDTWRYNTKTGHVNWLTHERMLPVQKSVPTTLRESADSLRAGISRHLEWNDETRKERPILFIASCLGGIILLKALEIDRSLVKVNSRPSLISATRGIIFLATPFLGTAFKDMPDWELKVWASLNGKEVSALIDYTKNPQALGDLVHTFIGLSKAHEYHVWTFWESCKTNLLSRIYLGWIFSERIYYALPMILVLARALDACFPPWLVALWLLWERCFPAFTPKQLVDKDSATARFFEGERLERQHVLMNKFNNCNKCDNYSGCKDCTNDYPKVAKKIEEILGTIRKGRTIDKADSYIRKEHYTADRLKIERLWVIRCRRGAGRSRKASETTEPESSPFSPTTRKIETPDENADIKLAKIFEKWPNDITKRSRRILIRGRAGVGKTILCKKIVHEFIHHGTWSTIFDRILWVPLRTLKTKPDKGYTLEERGAFAMELEKSIHDTGSARTLFVLDGLDEISEGLDTKSEMHSFLRSLLDQPNVIVTSRPFAKLPAYLRPDLELETIGFYPNQIQEYLQKVNPKQADEIQSFLQRRPLIQGLVRIPIQLDALCMAWAEGFDGEQAETMTAIYEAISQHLWRKESWRLDKRQENIAMTAAPVQIENDHKPALTFLECLAFNGMYSDVVEFQESHRQNIIRILPEFDVWLGKFSLGDISFLRTSDPLASESKRSYHFLHLTYQEFFAARYFARQWQDGKEVEFFKDFGKNKRDLATVKADAFLQENKYNMRYNIVWRFTVGLLEPDKVQTFFDAIQRQPLDLLGPTHQRLVMHCLKSRLSQWLSRECDMRGSSLLVAESEFPDEVLFTALAGSSSKKKQILRNKNEDKYARLKAANALKEKATLSETEVTALTEILKDKSEDRNIRSEAAYLLKGKLKLPNPDVATLIEILRDESEDKKIQSEAAYVLYGQSSLPEPYHKDARFNAAQALGRHLPEAIVTDLDARPYAAEVLSLQQQSLPEANVEALIAMFQDEDENIRLNAAKALTAQSRLSDATIAALVAMLKSKSEDIRSNAVRVLGWQSSLPDTALIALVPMLDALLMQPKLAEAAILILINMLEDPNCKQSSLPEVAVTALVEMLTERGTDRSDAAEALGGQSTLPEAAIAFLVEEIKQPSGDYAIEVLGRQSSLSEEVLTALVGVLENRSWRNQSIAAEILRRQSKLPESTATALATLLEYRDETTRYHAIHALETQSGLHESTVTTVVSLLKDRSSRVRSMASSVLWKQSNLSEVIVKTLMSTLEEESESGKFAVARALGEQPEFLDKILKVQGFFLEPQGTSESLNPKVMRLLYGCFIYRSFREHFCLYLEKDNLVISLPSGHQKRQASSVNFLDIILTARKLYKVDSDLLWNTPFREPYLEGDLGNS
ncbi:ARM repeat-containing protein [Nemania serpens]|nr:ARM repeat-containing protein [Nemania serpens]